SFPELSQTFVLNEITFLTDLGHDISIASLWNLKRKTIHKKIKKYGLLNKTIYLNQDIDSKKEWSNKKNFNILKSIFKTKMSKDKQNLLNILYDKRKNIKLILHDFYYCSKLIKKIKEEKIDHIHCHFACYNVYLVYVVSKILNIPYTFTTHAIDIFASPSKDIKKWANDAKKVITVSDYNKKYMMDKFGIDKKNIDVIHCGVNLNLFKPIDYNTNSQINILSVARLVEKKGIKYLIKSCKILKDQNINFHCSILGDGDLRNDLQKLIDKNNLKNVDLMGFVNQNKVLKEFEDSDVFVLPCIESSNGDKDGIPVSLMEAMAREVPVISTDVTGIPELIENNKNGVIVPQKDANALAEAIVKIKKNREFADRIRKKGREKVMEEFNIEKNVKKLVNIFEI
ncbi:glycosyltransferase, partial [Candidatus Dependentiae bacterium]|nr:glycosyltransferase [Candidatus Dependentiae bacterium]